MSRKWIYRMLACRIAEIRIVIIRVAMKWIDKLVRKGSKTKMFLRRIVVMNRIKVLIYLVLSQSLYLISEIQIRKVYKVISNNNI